MFFAVFIPIRLCTADKYLDLNTKMCYHIFVILTIVLYPAR